MELLSQSCHLVLLQQSAAAAVALCCGGGCKRMCCSSIVLCSYWHPSICRSLPSLSLSVYIECSKFGMSAVVPPSWLIGLTLYHHAPDVLVLCSWCTLFKQQRCHHARSLWPWKWQPACVCYLRTLTLSTEPSHPPWVMVRLWVFWGGFPPLQLPWGAPTRAGCVWPLCPISGGGAEKCTTNQQDS